MRKRSLTDVINRRDIEETTDREQLKKMLKGLFKSGEITIHVGKSWNEWHGESHTVEVHIDDELVYKKNG